MSRRPRVLYDDGSVRVLDLGTATRSDAGGALSHRVRDVTYDHVEDPADSVRRHEFGPGVTMEVLPGHRAVLLFGSRGQLIARDY